MTVESSTQLERMLSNGDTPLRRHDDLHGAEHRRSPEQHVSVNPGTSKIDRQIAEEGRGLAHLQFLRLYWDLTPSKQRPESDHLAVDSVSAGPEDEQATAN
jgi:hypothetical protein